jgi:[acyl-carrier-protein] S-malonyltransferase
VTFAVLCSGQGGLSETVYDWLETNGIGAAPIARQRALVDGRHPRDLGARLLDNTVAQPVIFTRAVAIWQALADDVPAPSTIAGYSAGEVAAYAITGALTDAAGLALIAARAEYMTAAVGNDPHTMVAVIGLDVAQAEALTREVAPDGAGGAYVALVNGPRHVVIAGTVAAITGIEAAAVARGATHVRRLDVRVASHTPLVARATAPFAAVLDAAPWQDGRAWTAPVLAGVSGVPVTTPAGARAALLGQLTGTVRWDRCLEALVERGVTVALDLGPGTALAGMIAQAGLPIEARRRRRLAPPSGGGVIAAAETRSRVVAAWTAEPAMTSVIPFTHNDGSSFCGSADLPAALR